MSTKLSKTAAILGYLQDHETASNSEVAEALSKKGYEISAAYVGTIKYNAAQKAAKGEAKPAGKRGRKPGSTNKPRTAKVAEVAATVSLSAEQLLQAKQLSLNLGGVGKVREALDVASQFINGFGSVEGAESALKTLELLDAVTAQVPAAPEAVGGPIAKVAKAS
jgi:hypothetical protein